MAPNKPRLSLSAVSSRLFRDSKLASKSRPVPSSAGSTAAASDSESDTESESSARATRPATTDSVELGFSFSGGGWLMIYMYGVAKAVCERDADRNARFIGTSAGSMAAIGVFLGADFDEVCQIVLNTYLPIARASLRGAFRVREFLKAALVAVGNVQDWEMTKLDPRACWIVYTSLSAMKSRRKSTFESQDDLVDALMASCTATPIAGFPFKYQGEWVMDGGVFDNQPLFQEGDKVKRTVTITPNVFDTTADIKPSKYIPPWWSMYPPTEEDLRWVFALGYEDGLAWCEQNGFPEFPSGDIMATREGSRSKALSAQVLVHKSKVAQYKTVLGQVLGYPIFEDVGNFCTFTGKISMYTLLKVELLLWMLLEVGFRSMDVITLWWTTVVAAAVTLLLVNGSAGTVAVECVLLCVTYVLVCGARLHHKSQEVLDTPRWKLVKESLDGMRDADLRAQAVSRGHVHGVKAIQVCHIEMEKEHHETLTEHSLLYRISTLLFV